MTDLCFCYTHMTDGELDQLDSSEPKFGFELDFEDVAVPIEFLPPEPDDEDRLPSQIHPSYPYGNPTKTPHPSTSGTVPMGILGSRALFEDVQIERKGVQTRINWGDLGLDQLFAVDVERAEALQAAAARLNNQTNPQPPQANNPQGEQSEVELIPGQEDDGESEDNDDEDEEPEGSGDEDEPAF